MPEYRVPVSTYRLQFTGELGFHEARELLPYLESLGITDLYASPLLQARAGSEHGYDVTDPRRLDREAGGRSGFEELAADLKARKMGLLLDIVPNHMAASPENPWWRDVLQWGPHSEHAGKFDIDWEKGREPGKPFGKLVLPILGAPLAEVLASGELTLALAPGGFQIHYHEHHLPVCPESYPFIWDEYRRNAEAAAGNGATPALLPLAVPTGAGSGTSADAMAEATRAGQRHWEPAKQDGQEKEHAGRLLEFWNSEAGDSLFSELLARQQYRLVYWKDTGCRINYRRFFDITDLVTLRIEDEAVFQAVHARVLELAREGTVTGLRIDHVDGLHDPESYLTRLRDKLTGRQPERESGPEASPPESAGASTVKDPGNRLPSFYMVIEKILKLDEKLPSSWPVAGTTGYDFLNMVNGVFVDSRGLDILDSLYSRVTGTTTDFAVLVNEQKRKVMRALFEGEIEALAEELAHLAAQDPRAREIPASDLKGALVGVTAAFPVYRTYTRGFALAPRDRQYLDEALALAARHGDGSEQARAFLGRLLMMQCDGEMPEEERHRRLSFVMRWQQFTGPIMAKGFEDTALYLYNRLLSLNEVGGDPAAGGTTVADFHMHMQARRASTPHTMNATSTHDTKRSEDVRARINVLTEIPELWTERVTRWQEWNAPHKTLAGGLPVPEGNAELLLYQTLVGAWPLHGADEERFIERLKEYLVKASREAKDNTSWLDPNEEYENAFCAFALRILEENTENPFRQNMKELAKTVAFFGALNSLAQVVLKAACPGVPDFFMGSELWDFSLVDPDNRRPVDFERRMRLLEELRQREAGPALAGELLNSWEDGRLKLFATWKALALRRAKAALFASGSYLPLEAAGPAREHVCALARHGGEDWVAAAVPRLPARMAVAGDCPDSLPELKLPVGREAWAGTMLLLPPGAPARWRNVFTGEIIHAAPQAEEPAAASGDQQGDGRSVLPLEKVCASFPAALLDPA